jgi:hypothetical protein
MGVYRVRIEAELSMPNKKNAESARDTIIKMLQESKFKEKDFIIIIDKTELVENLPAIEPKIIAEKKPVIHRTRRKIDKKVKPDKKKILKKPIKNKGRKAK